MISGTLLADFSDFSRAVKNAEVELRDMETGANKVGKMLNRMVDEFSGRELVQEAVATAEAIEQVGGASKLTERELARVAAETEEAIAKFKALGKEVPPELEKLSREVKEIGTASSGAGGKISEMGESLNDVDRVLDQVGINLGPIPRALEQFGTALNMPIEKLGAFKTAGLAAGAAFAGWEVGRWIAKIGDLDDKFYRLGDRLLGGAFAAEEAAAKTELLQRASTQAGRAITDFDEALKIMAEAGKASSVVTAKAAEEQKVLAEETKKAAELQRSLFSRDDIARANEYVVALGGVDNVTLLTTEKKAELRKVIEAALTAYTALGETAPAALTKIHAATTELITVTRSFSVVNSGVWAQYRETIEDGKDRMAAIAEESKLHWSDLGGHSREELEAIATAAAATYDYVQAHLENFTPKQIAEFRRAAEEAKRAANEWGTATIDTYEEIGTKAEATASRQVAAVNEVESAITGMSNRLGASSRPFGEGGGTLPNVNPATGEGMAGTDPRVQNYLQQGYTLGEAIALAQGRGTNIGAPHGEWTAGGWRETGGRVQAPRGATGTTVNLTQNITQPLGTPSEIGRVVSEALMQQMQSSGMRTVAPGF